MGGDLFLVVRFSTWAGFNPRPRMGGDTAWDFKQIDTNVVSIHAPAWGATYTQLRLEIHQPVSIHAPAWGATPKWPT